MMESVEDGQVAAIIVKDHSRFGLNRLVIGQLLEEILDEHNVRYIAVTDNIDALKGLGLGLFENSLFCKALLSTHHCQELSLECGNPYDAALNARKEYIDACYQLTMKLYIQQHFTNNLAVIYEDKYNRALKNEKEFIESCLASVENQIVPFHWTDEEETFYGTRYIWKTTKIDIKALGF